MTALATASRLVFSLSLLILTVYALRHTFWAVRRLCLRATLDYSEIEGFNLPRISVIVPMHNEEYVARSVLEALAGSVYDADRIEILAVDDRSRDNTRAIVDDCAAQFPQIRALHRDTGTGGKAAVLQFATEHASGEVLMIFDADYVPGRGILKMLAAPFADPRVGAVMGRVVPSNAGASLVSGLLSLERAAGYQVGQQARFNTGFQPQFGGTCGGVRVSALRAVGGWNTRSLTEDTDLTCRLVLGGWNVAYVNRAECYEQVPQSWYVRRKQIRRWAIGHTDCFHRFGLEVLRSPWLGFWQRFDFFLMLACYWTAPVMVLGWMASVILLFLQEPLPVAALGAALALIGCQMFASQASLLELASASFLDNAGARGLLLPLSMLSFFASTGAICGALGTYCFRAMLGRRDYDWHKTIRYRSGENGNGRINGDGNSDGNGDGNGNGDGGHPDTGRKS
jgi:cellulose synthase/poly-beta-1,6-N-acetylglucosamine synthase-like glycosyltransferase